MKIIITIMLAFIVSAALSQDKPKQHVYYDTIKTVKERVDYAPDTIPVYFKEIIISNNEVTERWVTGFLIWQTYKKADNRFVGLTRASSFTSSMGYINEPKYYKDDYEFTKGAPGSFLYIDKKPVTNKVFYCLKR